MKVHKYSWGKDEAEIRVSNFVAMNKGFTLHLFSGSQGSEEIKKKKSHVELVKNAQSQPQPLKF